MRLNRLISRALVVGTVLALLCATFLSDSPALARTRRPIQHVLLISVDGMHAVDLARFAQAHPTSALTTLSGMGVTYTSARAPQPSDSFPGLLAMLIGGTPRSTGVYYDDSYDRALSPPGSDCSTVGTEVLYDESIDKNPDAIDGGGGIDEAKLPRDPTQGCAPVYPHSYLRVNTLFEVVKAAGRRTAWADKHLAYDIVNGPSGTGVDDLYTPEINAGSATDSVAQTEANDDLKVQAILNQIAGKDHTGVQDVGVPAVFGMNFQAVSVAQKLPQNGYVDSQATPSTGLADALTHTDQSLGRMLTALQEGGLLNSTLIIVSAKHGQSPIDPATRRIVDSKLLPTIVNSVQAGLLAQATQDTIGLLWLHDQTRTADVAAALSAQQQDAAIGEVRSGPALALQFADPSRDSRVPDLIVLPHNGVIYAKPTATKIAEHGGFGDQDTHVVLLVANPRLSRTTIVTPVQTTQIAPTILQVLGLNPHALHAVQAEGTVALPGVDLTRKR